ncbi:MAG: hypothetical protein NZU63_07820 [Gemmataceae bacterium]|nr:hypothetical protein [Gemmataceae bacterium]
MTKRRPAIAWRVGMLLQVLLVTGISLAATQEAENKPVKVPESKGGSAVAKDKESFPKEPKGGIRLPDGTWLWTGSDDSNDRVSLPWREYQKLLAELEQWRRQAASRKLVTPSLCVVRVRIEQRGEQAVAVIRLSHSFRTSVSQAVVFLGGRKGLLTAATLDGTRLPALESNEEGYTATVETAGEHTLVLDLESPITPRGAKGEVGFEIGLPRAAITILQWEAPGQEIQRLNLVTRLTDPNQPGRPAEVRRLHALETRQLSAAAAGNGLPLGPIESLELTWDPPTRTPLGERVQTVEWDVTIQFAEMQVETTAKAVLRGNARQWRLNLPATASVSVERGPATAEMTAIVPPTVQRNNNNKHEWTVDFPAGASPSDWVVVVTHRLTRPRPEEAGHRGPFAIGPFQVANVFRQTGNVRLVAGPYVRFLVRHGPELRRQELPPGSDEDRSVAVFRLTTGPSGQQPSVQPLLTVEVQPLRGSLIVTPFYHVTLKPGGWQVETRLKLEPIRREVDTLVVEVPPEWRGVEAGPPEIVEGIQSEVGPIGFWQTIAQRVSSDPRVPLALRFAAAHKQPVQVTLTATVPVSADSRQLLLPLPRFPGATMGPTHLSVSVPEDQEVQGELREWVGGRAAATGVPIKPVPKNRAEESPRIQLQAVSSQAIAALHLTWRPYRPALVVESLADVTLSDQQIVVQQTLRLTTSAEPLPRVLHLQGSAAVRTPISTTVLEPDGSGRWRWNVLAESRQADLSLEYVVPRPPVGQTTLAVPLFQIMEASGGQHTVRLWSVATCPLDIRVTSSVWRDLPLETANDRPVWPARIIRAPWSDTVLPLEVSPRCERAITAWIERGLVQAWMGEDTTIRYRVRMRLRRWLNRTLLVQLPAGTDSASVAVLLDGRRLEPADVQKTEGGELVYQLALPEYQAAASLLLEMRYGVSGHQGEWTRTLLPPQLPQAAWDGPLLWHLVGPGSSLPLVGGAVQPQWRWIWQPAGLTLVSPREQEWERWLFSDIEEQKSNATGSGMPNGVWTVGGRQNQAAVIQVWLLPRWPVSLAVSLLLFIVPVAIWCLPTQLRWPTGAAVLLALAILLSLVPFSLLQLLVAGQWGIYAAFTAAVVLVLWRWRRQQQIRYLPGFRREGLAVGPMEAKVMAAGSRRTPLTAANPLSGRHGSVTTSASGNAAT